MYFIKHKKIQLLLNEKPASRGEFKTWKMCAAWNLSPAMDLGGSQPLAPVYQSLDPSIVWFSYIIQIKSLSFSKHVKEIM